MWAVLAFPPLTVPIRIDRPRTCPRCQAAIPLYVHQRVGRGVAHADKAYQYSSGLKLVTAYRAVRFRCPRCNKTVTPRHPGQASGFRSQRYLASRVVVAYCLGDSAELIKEELAFDGFALSRATVYRILRAAAEAHSDLRELHRVNRTRARRAVNRASRINWTFSGRWAEVATPRGFAPGAPSAWVDPPWDEDDESVFVDVCREVQIHRMYSNAQNRATLAWIDAYLRGLGNAGVLVYKNRRDLERDFDTYSDEMRETTRYDEVEEYLLESQLDRALDKTRPEIQRAVKLALRSAVGEDKDLEAFKDAATARRQFSDDTVTVVGAIRNDYVFDAPRSS